MKHNFRPYVYVNQILSFLRLKPKKLSFSQCSTGIPSSTAAVFCSMAGFGPINPGVCNDLYVNGTGAILDLNCAIKYIFYNSLKLSNT